MSQLLISGRTAPVAAWKAELATWETKLANIAEQLADKMREADDPSRDPWWGQQLKPTIDLLTIQRDQMTRVVAKLKEKLTASEAARPAALKELAAAYKERDALADEIAKRYPALIAELTDLMERAAGNERRLLRVAAAEEGENIDSTSPWDRARGEKHRPLVVQGPKKAAPAITLRSLDGTPLWPKNEPALTMVDLPSIVTATNIGDKLLFGSKPSGQPVVIEPGNSLTTTSLVSGLVNVPSVELTVQ